MSRCHLCRPTVALEATAPYWEASSGGGGPRGEVQGCVCVCVCRAPGVPPSPKGEGETICAGHHRGTRSPVPEPVEQAGQG